MRIIHLTILVLIFTINASAQRHIHISPSFRSGGWVVPTLTFGGAIYFGIRAVQSNKSITYVDGHQMVYGKNEPKRNGFAIFSAVCASATIGIVITMQSDK